VSGEVREAENKKRQAQKIISGPVFCRFSSLIMENKVIITKIKNFA